ncbi:MAG: hypothetical protein AB7S99_01185 [Pseudodonghicola sp.]
MPSLQKIVWPEPQAGSGILLITMVKDEQEMLRYWIRHYRACVENPDFLIVDDGSLLPVSDWISDEFPDCNISVIRLPGAAFSDLYKSGLLSSLAGIAVGRYKIVIPSDVDEIVMSAKPIAPHSLGEVLLASDPGFQCPRPYRKVSS